MKKPVLFFLLSSLLAVWLLGCGQPELIAVPAAPAADEIAAGPTVTPPAAADEEATPVETETAAATLPPATRRPTVTAPSATDSDPVTPTVKAPTVPAPSPTPAPNQPATATPTRPAAPAILRFEANVPRADPGDTITLTWETSAAPQVTLYRLLPSGQFGSFWQETASGSRSFEIDPGARNQVTFLLFAGEGDNYDDASVIIALNCPFPWFFEPGLDECAFEAPEVSAAAYQPFQQGHMMWIGSEKRIVVFYTDTSSTTKWQLFSDEWEPGDPVDDPALVPPAGLFQPVRGFGLVWREMPQVRERLGWATAPERGFETIHQTTARGKYNDNFLRGPDGRVWLLLPEGSGWEIKN